MDTTASPNDTVRRRRVLALVGGAVLVAALVFAVVRTGDERPASETASVDEGPAATVPADDGSLPIAASTDSLGTMSMGSTTSTTDAPQPLLPTTPIPRTDEASTCRGIVVRLTAFRDLAVSEPLTSLLTLQLGLDEFEHEVDFLADGHDWGQLMVEQLVQVRRDWSTAYSAHRAGDSETASTRAASALESLDDAIEVACPEG